MSELRSTEEYFQQEPVETVAPSLTEEQQARLSAVLDELDKLPTPEMLSVAAGLQVRWPFDEVETRLLNRSIDGAYAFHTITNYLVTLRQIDEERIALNQKVRMFRDQAKELQQTNAVKSVESDLVATQLAGKVNVQIHLFVTCLWQIRRMLIAMAGRIGFKIPKADLKVLESYRALRHLFEHLEERLPGDSEPNEKVSELFTVTLSEHELLWSMGLKTDGQGRVLLNNVAIDVTSRGVEAIEDILQHAWGLIRAGCSTNVARYFTGHPNEIPEARSILTDPLASVDPAWESTADLEHSE